MSVISLLNILWGYLSIIIKRYIRNSKIVWLDFKAEKIFT